MKKLLLASFALVLTLGTTAQTRVWSKTYDGNQPHTSSDQSGRKVVTDAAGNVYVASTTQSQSSNDIMLIKYLADGTLSWSKVYNGYGNSTEVPRALAIDVNGDVIVGGYAFGVSDDFLALKYSPDGTLKWAKQYDYNDREEQVKGMALDAIGNIYLTGPTAKFTGDDFLAMKIGTDGTQIWAKSFNGVADNMDTPAAIGVDTDGNVYVTGTTISSPYSDILTIKYSNSGDTVWTNIFNSTSNYTDAPTSLAIDANGNVIISGNSSSGQTTSWDDILVLKYLSDGTQSWKTTWTGPLTNQDLAKAMTLDADGNIYVVGSSNTGTWTDYVTLEVLADGNISWSKTYNGTGAKTDVGLAIQLDNSKNVIVTGNANATNTDYLTIKYDNDGTQLWTKAYNGTSNDQPYALAVDASGNIVVTGQSSNGSYNDCVTVKYAPTGTQSWVKTFNLSANKDDYAGSIATDKAGNIYVTGTVALAAPTYGDIITTKYHANGFKVWTKTYSKSASSDDGAYKVICDSTGNIYVAGYSYTGSSYDFTTIKYKSDGTQLWVKNFNGPDNLDDEAFFIQLDYAGNIYVAGTSKTTKNSTDFSLVKYAPDGTQLWSKKTSVAQNVTGYLNALTIDNQGRAYLAGTILTPTNFDMMWVRYSEDGSSSMTEVYNGPMDKSDDASAIAVDKDGNIYVAGYSALASGNDYSTDMAIIKYLPDGTQSWIRTHGDTMPGVDEINAMVLDNDGNIYVTGTMFDRSYYITTLKYNPNGDQVWLKRFNGNERANDFPYDIAINDAGFVVVAGKSPNFGISRSTVLLYNAQNGADEGVLLSLDEDGNMQNGAGLIVSKDQIYVGSTSKTPERADADFLLIKYCSDVANCDTVGTDGIAQTELASLELYPNPTVDKVTVKGLKHNTTIDVMNVFGQKVKVLQLSVDGDQSVDLSELTPGTYFLKFIGFGGESFTHKVIKTNR